jgi:hypothetical protein
MVIPNQTSAWTPRANRRRKAFLAVVFRSMDDAVSQTWKSMWTFRADLHDYPLLVLHPAP